MAHTHRNILRSRKFTPIRKRRVLITLKKKAVETLEKTNSTIGGDVMFNGNLNKWVRFANSLRFGIFRTSKNARISAEMKALATSES
jgi:hypothetical protein